ncbi:YihY/virulence factor BrkB family protein [uncultured Chitinophaga sp.]|jgi:Predicted membrane protein|uniref:YihY/virulence factor BrkB family protein n=1 Tax=uncultured Chitinophaga sp. TaxID=339340 RepID=UPI002615BFCE|nr:YihY/virulence factor BrkB family protein [uncultured Chitinophaga sp.]
MKRFTPKAFWTVLKQTFKGFGKDNVPKLSAALAYYTIFSLGPMMIVILFLADIFWGREAIQGRLYSQIQDLVGGKAAIQIQEVIKNASIDSSNTVTTVVGFVTLFIGATTVFSEIQESINIIWKLKVKPKQGFLKFLISRLLSFSLVVGLAFLLLVSLLINALMEGFMDRLKQLFPDVTISLFYVLNLGLTFLIIWFLFAIIFKVLPDARIRWKDVMAGALFTALLFMAGKFLITFYIGRSDVGSAYGTAGSLVVLLLWIFFSSVVLYSGAEFTKCYAIMFSSEIKPNDYAVAVQPVQLESSNTTLQENEKAAEIQSTGKDPHSSIKT